MSLPLVGSSSDAGIAFSIGVVVLAGANLLTNFDFIDREIAAKAPRHMKWYAASGALMTAVWMYLEVLRLLAKLRDN